MKNMTKCLKNMKFFLIAAAIFGFSLVPARAQSTPASGQLLLTTSPLPINLKVTPGTSVSAPIKIKNDGNQDENLKVTLMKFKADPVTGATILSEREPADTYFDWVTFSDPTFTLQPNEWKTVTATFNVPTTASFDYYYAIVFFRADQKVQPGDRQTVLNGGTATMVLLTADVPDAKKELTLDQFTVNKNIFEFLPAIFNVKLRNTGNVHVIPHGNI
ncbi:MAG: Fn3-like domain-containing protein, partial [Candidatus Pacebacteria bacterium]|nr:Fn3-like domain-containing protein [Candidatus Paceibacterota bacterium]